MDSHVVTMLPSTTMPRTVRNTARSFATYEGGRECIRDDVAVGRIGGHAFHMFCCVAMSLLNVVIPS